MLWSENKSILHDAHFLEKQIAVGNPGGGPLTTRQFNIKARKQKKKPKSKVLLNHIK